jgi:cytochrome c oxidase assembly protein subunit 15
MNNVITARNRAVATWLLICCGLVFAMVVLGGVTRLTGSGLSMVDWRPIMGALPPLNDDQWQATFELYQQSPEFQKVNSHMNVDDFKGIFWLEYLHRLLGRTIGLAFLLPFLYFSWKGHIKRPQLPKYALMFVLGGLQGLLGWYMVKSGLVDNPHVSHYRLTAHLAAAFLIYAYMFWVALGLLYGNEAQPHPWYRRTLALTALVTLTVLSGGFVAGLKAGLIYNTFPKMGGEWIPYGMFALEPAWRNFFDNLATVQFDHRVLAITTLVLVVTYWVHVRSAGFSARLVRATHVFLGLTALQVTLGISTLLLKVPVALGAAHQGVALLLFTAALYLSHGLRHKH